MINRFIIAFLMSLVVSSTFASTTNPKWMRYPAISPNGKNIAFAYKGSIYKMPAEGGDAIRLTFGDSYNTNPIWSPNSSKIAFISDREGGLDIFIMDTDGSGLRRITEFPGNEYPYTFTPDGKYIVFSSHLQDPYKSVAFPTGRLTELYKIGVEKGDLHRILSTAAEKVKFNREGTKFIYQDIKGFENQWRKHHTSSVTRDIVEYDIKKDEFKTIINWQGEDREPVYNKDENGIYFLSEKSGSFNIFYKDLKSGKEEQKTFFKTNPIRFLSISDNDKLCFGYDGEIYTKEKGREPSKLNINIVGDNNIKEVKNMSFHSGASSASISPDGKQVSMIIRGNVFVTSVDYPTTKAITNTIEAEASASFSPDNRSIIYASDREGAWNIYKASIARKNDINFPNSTLIKEEVLFKNDGIDRMYPKFSPDGKEVAYVEDREKLMVLNLQTNKVRQITDGSNNYRTTGYIDYEWSPDGKWFSLSYIGNKHDPYGDIGIVSSNGGEIFNITQSGYSDDSPRWVLDGNAILFRTERYGMRNHASWGSLNDVMIVFMNREAYDKFRLSKEDYSLLKEVESKNISNKVENKKSKIKKSDKKKTHKDESIKIEFKNLRDRIIRLTPNSSRLGDAIIDKKGENLYYMSSFEGGFDLWKMNLRTRSTNIVNKLNGGWGSLSMDKNGSNLFILGSRSMYKMSLSSSKLSRISYNAKMKMDLAKERKYMFDYAWNEESKRFYRKDMHNVDWKLMKEIYSKHLPYINNNYDFSELLSEMLGELNVSHTGSGYSGSGRPEAVGELGLIFDFNKIGSGLKIDEVIENSPFDNYMSKVKKGDIIEKINGDEVNSYTDYVKSMTGKSKEKILVSIYRPDKKQRWDEVVIPIFSHNLNSLLYNRWIKRQEFLVDSLSNGRLGYVHIPSMGDPSFRSVYSDILGKYNDREGIVIDIRYNGGGRLHEDVEVLFSGKKYLTQVIRGKEACDMPSRRWNKPSIMLICEADYSNAHGTPWVYKHMGLGKLVGMPVPGTMTSVNWESLQDDSMYFGIPVVGYRLDDGSYLENQQLNPDVFVKLDPHKLLKGYDTQTAKAVEVLMKNLTITQ